MTASVNHKDHNGFTPLHIAVDNHQIKLAQFLILRGAGVDDKTNNFKTPIHISCENKDLDLFILLFNSRASLFSQDLEGNTPLHLLCQNECIEIIKWIKKNYDLKYLLNIKNHNSRLPFEMTKNLEIYNILSNINKNIPFYPKLSNDLNKLQLPLDKIKSAKVEKPIGDEFEDELDIDYSLS